MLQQNMKIWFKLLLFFAVIVFVLYSLTTTLHLKFKISHFRNPNLKYILQWTSPLTEPFKDMGIGQEVFLKYHCPVNNCYITPDKEFMNDLTDFHAILFHGPELSEGNVMPESRLPHQKYIFVSMESPIYYPLNEAKYNSFFNWTFTYKLNSDIYFGYIAIKNKNGVVIGPKETMHWMRTEEMKPVTKAFKDELKDKRKFAAWFVSNCYTKGKRESYVNHMALKLYEYHYENFSIDYYGACRRRKCPRDMQENCEMLLRKLYYFYLSFENSLSSDYVTEKLLRALNNYAIPVVFGGANYTRFMPDGAYLNAKKNSPRNLISRMLDIVNNKTKYYDFFRWRNHYTYHSVYESIETNPYCTLCSKLNENTSSSNPIKYYKNFGRWWSNQTEFKRKDYKN